MTTQGKSKRPKVPEVPKRTPRAKTSSTAKSTAAKPKPKAKAKPKPKARPRKAGAPAANAKRKKTRGGGNRSRGGRSRGGRTNMKNISKNWRQAPSTSNQKVAQNTKPVGKNGNKLRIAVIGGAEEVGRNMAMVEYGNDIVLIDCGLQFPEEEMPGIDYIIPNVDYFKGKEKNIRGIIVTHAHLDHIGAIPHIAPILHNPPIYSAPLTLGIIAKRQDDHRDKPKLDLRQVDIDGQLKLGDLIVEFVRINHSVPDSLAIVVRTPEGIVLHTGDFKFDLEPIGDQVTDFDKLTSLGKEGVLALMCDSTSAPSAGQQLSESHIGRTLEGIMEKAEERIIIGTFSSQLNRVQQLLWIAEKLDRFVVLEGFSMKTNVEIAVQLGYLKVNPKTIISPQDAKKLPPHKLVIVGTGAQGESNAAMMKMATGEHRHFNIEKGDTVIFSSSVVPGNERAVQVVKDLLISEGAEVIHYQMMDVHAGGHAKAEDLKLMIRMINPEYFIPIEGNLHLLDANGRIAKGLGWEDDKVLITSNGRIMEFAGGEGRLTKEVIPNEYVFVDGLGVGDVSEVVLRDRQMLSEDGMLIVIASIDGQTGDLVGEPDVISRGFVYMKDNKGLVDETKKQVVKILGPHLKGKPNPVDLKNKLRDGMGEFIFKKIQRRPMILPVIVEV